MGLDESTAGQRGPVPLSFYDARDTLPTLSIGVFRTPVNRIRSRLRFLACQ